MTGGQLVLAVVIVVILWYYYPTIQQYITKKQDTPNIAPVDQGLLNVPDESKKLAEEILDPVLLAALSQDRYMQSQLNSDAQGNYDAIDRFLLNNMQTSTSDLYVPDYTLGDSAVGPIQTAINDQNYKDQIAAYYQMKNLTSM